MCLSGSYNSAFSNDHRHHFFRLPVKNKDSVAFSGMMLMQMQRLPPPFSNAHTHMHVQCSVYLFISPTSPFFFSNCSIGNMGSIIPTGNCITEKCEISQKHLPPKCFLYQSVLVQRPCNNLHSSSTSLIPLHPLLRPTILVNDTVPKYAEAVRAAKHESK